MRIGTSFFTFIATIVTCALALRIKRLFSKSNGDRNEKPSQNTQPPRASLTVPPSAAPTTAKTTEVAPQIVRTPSPTACAASSPRVSAPASPELTPTVAASSSALAPVKLSLIPVPDDGNCLYAAFAIAAGIDKTALEIKEESNDKIISVLCGDDLLQRHEIIESMRTQISEAVSDHMHNGIIFFNPIEGLSNSENIQILESGAKPSAGGLVEDFLRATGKTSLIPTHTPRESIDNFVKHQKEFWDEIVNLVQSASIEVVSDVCLEITKERAKGGPHTLQALAYLYPDRKICIHYEGHDSQTIYNPSASKSIHLSYTAHNSHYNALVEV